MKKIVASLKRCILLCVIALYSLTTNAVSSKSCLGGGEIFSFLAKGKAITDNLPSYDLKIISAISTQNVEGTLTVLTTIINNGLRDVTEFDLTFSANDYYYIHTVKESIVSGTTVQITTILYDIPKEAGFVYPLTVTATRIVDGDDGTPEDNKTVVSMQILRNVVVEEYTGNSCGWCPRGLVGMDKLKGRYGERYIGIAIHSFNSSDPMYPIRYKNLGFDGAPDSKLNRSYFMDPYYGKGNDICEDFETEMLQPSYVSLTLSATFNEDRSAVDIIADVKSLEDLNGATLGFVLTADSLTGTTRAWKQTNYYNQYTASQLPDDLKQFAKGGINGESSFFWYFNDVAISTYYQDGSYEMYLGNIGGNEIKTVFTTLAMPTKTTLLEAIRYDLITANVFVIDANGGVANAAKVRVVDFSPNMPIQFVDSTVKSLCVDNWDTNGDGELDEDEAAAVTSLGTVFKKKDIISFNELKYFTGLKSISEGAFASSNIQEVTIPPNVISLEKDAFLSCKSLKSFYIPAKVTSIGQNALSGCTSMTSITVDESNDTYCSINGVLFSKDKKQLLQFPCAKSTVYAVPEGTEIIGRDAFYNSQIQSVTLPSTLKELVYDAFGYCKQLTEVDLPEGLESIGDYIFDGCTSLKAIHIPSTITTIGKSMAQGCNAITDVYCGMRSPFAINDNNFTSIVYVNATLHVPSGTKEKYISLNGWRNFSIIQSDGVVESYISVSQDGKVATFYHDNKKDERLGIVFNIDSYQGLGADTASVVTKVVFDPSFADVRPTSTYLWFYKMNKLTSIEGLEYLNTSEVTNMQAMFSSCSSLVSLDLSHFDTSKVTTMRNMFNGCSSLTSLDVSSFNTSNVTTMYRMFNDCSKLTSLDVSGFNTSMVTDAYRMFYGCSKLSSLDVSNFVTSNITTMGYMFYNCSNLISLDVSNFNTSKVTNMEHMFSNCKKLTLLNVSGFNTANVTTMEGLFNFCNSLDGIDVKGFNTSKVKNMRLMFNECNNLKMLDLSNFDTSKTTNTSSMLDNCYNLLSLAISGTMGNLNDNACNKVGTEETPCLITAPESFVFGVETTGSFLWKSGWFTFGNTNCCTLMVETLLIHAGRVVDLPIDLSIDREELYNGFQFDITLPEGITLVKNGDKYAYALSARYTNEMQVSFNELGGNEWRLMVYSFNNTKLTRLDSEVITLSVAADKNISETDCFGSIDNIKLSRIDGESLPVPSMTFEIQVAPYQPLYCEADPLRPSMTSNMSIYLSIDSEDLYNGYQFDITLPEGVTLAKDGTSYAYALANRYTDNMQVSFNELGESQWRVMVYSLTNAMLTGLDGEIITLSIVADENISDDNLSGFIANFRLSRVDGRSILYPDVAFTFEVADNNSCLIGDVNNDGDINISDVVCIVSWIMGEVPPVFIREVADYNHDGMITITDVTALVNYILSGSSANRNNLLDYDDVIETNMVR